MFNSDAGARRGLCIEGVLEFRVSSTTVVLLGLLW